MKQFKQTNFRKRKDAPRASIKKISRLARKMQAPAESTAVNTF